MLRVHSKTIFVWVLLGFLERFSRYLLYNIAICKLFQSDLLYLSDLAFMLLLYESMISTLCVIIKQNSIFQIFFILKEISVLTAAMSLKGMVVLGAV